MGKTSHQELHHSGVNKSGHLTPIEKADLASHGTESVIGQKASKDKANSIITDYQIRF